ncbi:MAG: sigma 54-interacting transcriptional regulator [Acidobacteria bacterium]|nr:sigma 54-interacting transcriptional regulator [Acidobacteriota bacterium]
MSDRAIDGNFQTVVIDDKPQVRELIAFSEQLSERFQGSSPTTRMAAYHSDKDLVGRSQAFLEVMKHVERVANTDLPVLLTGKSRTGTELVAAAIHQRSSRSDKPFVTVKCSADRDELEQWEKADGGTIFFSEITETTPSFQAHLLRTLQTGEICRAGSSQTQRVNVRVIAATDRNVDQEVAAGRFHRDLLNCLNSVSIALPPLRALNYSQSAAETNGHSTETSQEEWVPLSTIEGRYVAQVLEHTRGNKQAAARVLAVDRKTLDRMIKRHHIDSERVRRAYR